MVRLFFSLPYSPPLFFSFLSILKSPHYHHLAIFIDKDRELLNSPKPNQLDQIDLLYLILLLAIFLHIRQGNWSCKAVHYVAKPDGA